MIKQNPQAIKQHRKKLNEIKKNKHPRYLLIVLWDMIKKKEPSSSSCWCEIPFMPTSVWYYSRFQGISDTNNWKLKQKIHQRKNYHSWRCLNISRIYIYLCIYMNMYIICVYTQRMSIYFLKSHDLPQCACQVELKINNKETRTSHRECNYT